LLSNPDISPAIIRNVLGQFGLSDAHAVFHPSGDANSAVYHVIANGARYLLKMRCGDFDEIAVTVPAFLRASGIDRVMATIPASGGRPWIRLHGFDWMLYPFFDGRSGFEQPLSENHWTALGETLRQIHDAVLPDEIANRVPRISYHPRYRSIVRALDRDVDRRRFEDPIAADLAAFWKQHRSDIRSALDRAEQLASTMQQREWRRVLCHSDLHAGNVLVGADRALAVIDWDSPVIAPKERDLMFVGGGIGGAWNLLQESEWFFRGYGSAEVDLAAIAFFRYERILVDVAEYGERIFGSIGDDDARRESVRRLKEAFLPDDVIDIAHRSFSKIG
jgi:spectinomycin phosphotransferase